MFQMGGKKNTNEKQVLILIVIIILDGGFVFYEVEFFCVEFLELNGLVFLGDLANYLIWIPIKQSVFHGEYPAGYFRGSHQDS